MDGSQFADAEASGFNPYTYVSEKYATDKNAERYRVGRKNPRNIYRITSNDDYLTDTHIGVMFDPDDGPLVVAALNCAAHQDDEDAR